MKRSARESLFERLVCAAASNGEPGPLSTPCWIWPGSKCNKGYGQIWTDGRSRRMHIAAWELVKGRKVRRGYTLDHRCRNRACWRPSHMEEVTRAVNTARGNRANPRSTVAATAARRAQNATGEHARMLIERDRPREAYRGPAVDYPGPAEMMRRVGGERCACGFRVGKRCMCKL